MAHMSHLHDDVSPISLPSLVALLSIFIFVVCAPDERLDDIRAAD